MIRHHAFLDASSQLPGGSPTWHATMAGYLVIGLFDAWHRLEPVELVDDQTFENVGRMVDTIPSQYRAEQLALQNILRVLIDVPCMARPYYVAGPILAYGAALEHGIRWHLAVDVYQTIAEAFELDMRSTEADFSTAGYARRREAFCSRNTYDYENAERAYGQSLQLGERVSDDNVRLHAKMGMSAMARIRGNIPRAEQGLKDLFAECETCDPKVAAILRPGLLHMSGTHKHERRQYFRALTDFLAAYQLSQNPEAKEVIYSDIAICVGDVGSIDTGRSMLSKMAFSANNLFLRQSAIVNLIDLETRYGNESQVARWIDIWQPEHCNALLHAFARLVIAQSIKRFGTQQQAHKAFIDAADFAAQAGIHKIQFEAMREGNLR